MKYATATFWEGLAERAISTFAQSLVGAFGVGTSLFGLDWKGALGIAGAAALASVLKSFSLPEETDPWPRPRWRPTTPATPPAWPAEVVR